MKSPIHFPNLASAITALGCLVLTQTAALANNLTPISAPSFGSSDHPLWLAQLDASDPPPRSSGGGTRLEKPPTRRGGGTRFVPPLPQGMEAPGHARGGASRSTCPAVTTKLTALIPTAEVSTQRANGRTHTTVNVFGQTVADRPVFWFYVPYTNQVANLTEFVLQDATGKEIYKTPITLPQNPGVMAVRIPQDKPALESGKLYQWFFQYYCAPNKTSRPIFVNGWVQRIGLSADLKKQLTTATTLRERAQIYDKNNLWFDALTTLADARRAKPKDEALLGDWQKLLTEVDLSDIAAEPFTN